MQSAAKSVHLTMLLNTERSYGWVSILLHWAIGLLFIFQIGLGVAMVRLDDQRRAFELIQLHKSIGFVLLALVLLRLAWRVVSAPPRPPDGISRIERLAAAGSHRLLYVFMIVMPLSGWVLVSVSTLDMPTFAFYRVIIPNLPLPQSDVLEELWADIHQAAGYMSAALIVVHVLAALWHQFIRRDRLLTRMFWAGREDTTLRRR